MRLIFQTLTILHFSFVACSARGTHGKITWWDNVTTRRCVKVEWWGIQCKQFGVTSYISRVYTASHPWKVFSLKNILIVFLTSFFLQNLTCWLHLESRSQITRWLRGPELLECILWAVSPYRRSLFASKKILKRNWCQRAELWEWGARKVGFLGGVFSLPTSIICKTVGSH